MRRRSRAESKLYPRNLAHDARQHLVFLAKGDFRFAASKSGMKGSDSTPPWRWSRARDRYERNAPQLTLSAEERRCFDCHLVSPLALLSVACGPPTSGGGGGRQPTRGHQLRRRHRMSGRRGVPKRLVHRALGLSLRLGLRQRPNVHQQRMCRCVASLRRHPRRAAGEICEDNQCQPQGASCTADRDCARGEVCSNGRCQRGDGTCGSDNDCPVGQSCRNGQCLTTGGGDECLRNRDCPAGQICEKRQLHRGREPARKTETATSVRLAKTGSALTSVAGACRTHAQCTAPQVCVVGAGQASGTRQSLVGRRCGGDSDCAFTDAQNATVSGTCESGRCKVRQFGSCTGRCVTLHDRPHRTTLPNQNRLCSRNVPLQLSV